MFQDLDATLAVLLAQELATAYSNFTTDNISFVAPDAEFRNQSGTAVALNLFLYDLRENWELRSNERQVSQQNGMFSGQRPAARVDCAYLITAWSPEKGRSGIEAEHRLLGQVMRVLLRYRQLPANALQGSLVGQEPPLRARVMQQGQLQSLGEFWQAMGGQPKAALHYTVTVSMELFAAEDLGPPPKLSIKIKQGLEAK